MSVEKQNYRRLVKDLSLTLNVPVNTINHVLLFVFGRVRDGFERGELESYFITNLGTFYVTEYKRTKLREYREKHGFVHKETRLERRKRAALGDNGRLDESSQGGNGDSQAGSGGNGESQGIHLCNVSDE